VPVIAITDSSLSPLKAAARVCFELGDDSTRPFRSLVAPLCLAQTLVVSTGTISPARREAPQRNDQGRRMRMRERARSAGARITPSETTS
jgi:DNA-binding MurR/RpiR family transcriptional regulator